MIIVPEIWGSSQLTFIRIAQYPTYRHIHTWSPTIVGVQMMNLSQVFPKVAACFHSELSP